MTGGTPSGHRLLGISWMRLLSTSPSVATSALLTACFASLAGCLRAALPRATGWTALVAAMSFAGGVGTLLNMLRRDKLAIRPFRNHACRLRLE